MESDDLVCAYTLDDVNKAKIIKNYLQSEGIACRLGEEQQGGLPGVIEVEILVRAIDADRARNLIESHESHE